MYRAEIHAGNVYIHDTSQDDRCIAVIPNAREGDRADVEGEEVVVTRQSGEWTSYDIQTGEKLREGKKEEAPEAGDSQASK